MAADDVLMTVGSITFSVPLGAFETLRQRLEIRTAKSERAGAQTTRQSLGHDDTIEISSVYFPEWTHSTTRLADLRALALTYQPQMLTDGLGNVWGKYLIEDVDAEGSVFTAYGVPLRQTFRLSLGVSDDS